MAQHNDDLTLGTSLIRKGEARGVSPTAVTKLAPEPPPPAVPPQTPPPAPIALEEPDPPLRAVPPDDIPKRFTSFRLPVSLDEELRAMMFETRRSKQDLLISFVTEGIKAWRRERLKRAG